MHILPMFGHPGYASCMRHLQWKDQMLAPTKKQTNKHQKKSLKQTTERNTLQS